MKILAIAMKLFAAMVGGIILTTAATVYFFTESLPIVTVRNQCGTPIQLPEAIKLIPNMPNYIDIGAEETFPIMFGAGEYALYDHYGQLRLRLPMELPGVGESLMVYHTTQLPLMAFDGELVKLPMQQSLRTKQHYTMVVCPV